MGYDLHITRAQDWLGSESQPIGEADWRACVAADAELELTGAVEALPLTYENPGLAVWRAHPSGDSVWFDLRDGRVTVKNPDEATIAKALSIAKRLKARVVGDDGEEYEEPGKGPRQPSLSLRERVTSWFERLRPTTEMEPPDLQFAAGDRVRDFRGEEGTVVGIDLKVTHGLGSVRVRFDDGRELDFAAIAHDVDVSRLERRMCQ